MRRMCVNIRESPRHVNGVADIYAPAVRGRITRGSIYRSFYTAAGRDLVPSYELRGARLSALPHNAID